MTEKDVRTCGKCPFYNQRIPHCAILMSLTEYKRAYSKEEEFQPETTCRYNLPEAPIDVTPENIAIILNSREKTFYNIHNPLGPKDLVQGTLENLNKLQLDHAHL